MRLCSVADCDGESYCRGMCQKHYMRWYRHGSSDVTYPGATWVRPNGYKNHRRRHAPGGERQQYEHRVVLMEKIGPGEHSCHWCGKTIVWGVDLHTDHLDDDRLNNDPENLVPTCQPCNNRRMLARRYGTPWPKEVV